MIIDRDGKIGIYCQCQEYSRVGTSPFWVIAVLSGDICHTTIRRQVQWLTKETVGKVVH